MHEQHEDKKHNKTTLLDMRQTAFLDENSQNTSPCGTIRSPKDKNQTKHNF